MSTPIPIAPAVPSGARSVEQSGRTPAPPEGGAQGLLFVEMLAATLGGGTAVQRVPEEGEVPPAELPLAGEEGNILPPEPPALSFFSALVSAPQPQEMAAARPLQAVAAAGGQQALFPAAILLPGAGGEPEPGLIPALQAAVVGGDPDTPFQASAPVREPQLAVALRAVDEVELPAVTGSTPHISPAGAGGSTASTLERPSLPLNAQLHSPQWQSALGERMVWMVKRDLQQAELRLNPQHLGPVEVRIEIRNEQASITFSAHHALTRDALEAAIPRLREMLGESGVNLGSVDISRQQTGSGQGQQREGGGQHRDRSSLPEATTAITDNLSGGGRPLYGGTGLVDLFA